MAVLVTSTTLTPNDVYNAFITEVYNPVVASGAVYHSGNQHPAPGGTGTRLNASDYGSAANPTFTVGDIPDTQSAHGIIRVYYVLHNMAMQLTRIRQAYHYYTSNMGGTTAHLHYSNSGRTALKTGLELYFPIPAGVPPQGSTVTAAHLNAFLANLRAAASSRRTSAGYAHIFVSQWCHTNCHGSRGRR